MAKAKGDRIIINLACSECRKYRYTTEKNRRHDTDRMQLRKFCPRCRAHQPFRETR